MAHIDLTWCDLSYSLHNFAVQTAVQGIILGLVSKMIFWATAIALHRTTESGSALRHGSRFLSIWLSFRISAKENASNKMAHVKDFCSLKAGICYIWYLLHPCSTFQLFWISEVANNTFKKENAEYCKYI